jgi:hypothetical protein
MASKYSPDDEDEEDEVDEEDEEVDSQQTLHFLLQTLQFASVLLATFSPFLAAEHGQVSLATYLQISLVLLIRIVLFRPTGTLKGSDIICREYASSNSNLYFHSKGEKEQRALFRKSSRGRVHSSLAQICS